jgi:hypothetical protein
MKSQAHGVACRKKKDSGRKLMTFVSCKSHARARCVASGAIAAGLLLGTMAAFGATLASDGVLVTLKPSQVASFDARFSVTAVRLNPHRDLYLVTSTNGTSDRQLLLEIEASATGGHASLNTYIRMDGQSTASVLNGQSTASVLNGQSTASVLNGQSTASVLNGQSTASVLNGQSTASVLNGGSTVSFLSGENTSLDQSTASVLNSEVNYFGTRAPSQYVDQPAVGQVAAGEEAHELATGKGVVVALIDNGVDQFNPVLRKVLLRRQGWNFYDNSPNWSAFADLGQSTASVLNGQSTASVLNNGDTTTLSTWNGGGFTLDQSTASVLNGARGALGWLLDQSTASVLNGCPNPAAAVGDSVSSGAIPSTLSYLNQSTASVLNSNQQLIQLVLKLIENILSCDPDFGHGTSVAGLIHLIAPEARILPIKAFGPGGTAPASAIYQSLTYAIDHHAQVINLSFSATGLDPNVQAAIREAVGKGIIVAAAAGNSDSDAPVYPASLPGVVGVGAVDACNAPAPTATNPAPGCIANPVFNRAAFSNYDPSTGIVDADVAAPGVQLFTTFPGFGLIWATSSGTSFSAPIVAGEAALLVQLRQQGDANRDEIENTSNPAIPGDLNGALGHGMVQVLGALKTAPAPSGHGGRGDHQDGHGRGH